MDIQFKEEKRNQPHWANWYSQETDYIDTYFKKDGKWLFLRGIAECAPDYEKQEIETLKAQLVTNQCKFIRYYCHTPLDNPSPLALITWVKDNNLRYEPFTRFKYLSKSMGWEFGGNCCEYSAAFDFRIFDRALAIKVKRAFIESQDPTFAERHNQYLERLAPAKR